jgi:hypothetical protein
VTFRAIAAMVLLGLAAAACGSAAVASPSPSPSTSPVPTATPAAPAPTVTAAPIPTAAPPTPVPPTPVPSATPGASLACATLPQTGVVPSDRLTGVEVLGLPGRDVVRFTFGEGSLTPAGAATGTLAVAGPPFTEASSGRPIDLGGEHALQVVFKGMSLQNDVGQPTFDGDRDIRVADPARRLRHVVIFDESEGQIGWYVGYDGPSCVTLTREGDTIVLAIDWSG